MLLLLLDVCANTANLMLARASTRQRQIGVRQALGAGRGGLRSVLVAAEVALALVVLVVAARFLTSFGETRDADPGFRREGVLLATYDLTGRVTSRDAERAFAAALLGRLRALPGVQSAAIATSVPLDIHGLPLRPFA